MNNDYPENWPHIIDWFILDDNKQSKYYLFLIGDKLYGQKESLMDSWKNSNIIEKQVLKKERIKYMILN